MIGQKIQPGDFFLIPGGNVRYGGLVLEIGIVLSMTEKRMKTVITKFDKIKLKPTTKTSAKVFKLPVTSNVFYTKEKTNEQKIFYENAAMLALQEAYDKQEASNAT